MLREAFAHALDETANMIRFGSMLEDLECYVDNSIVWSEDKGRIVGRRGGIRQWLRENAPDLSERYKTVMKYKALAKKFRQAVGVCDPVPAVAVLPPERSIKQDDSGMTRKRSEERRTREHSSEHSLRKQRKADRTETTGGKNGTSPEEVAEALLETCEGTVASLSARLALMVSADFVPCENIARTKNSCEKDCGDGRARSSA